MTDTDTNKKKIVVVEDDKALVEALNIHLTKHGFEVISALDGEDGIELVKENKPDLILLDIVMPKINGFEVLKFLKDNDELKEIPVIILTNLGQDGDVKKGMELGADSYIVKATTDLANVVEEIGKVLNK